ncbi:MAG: ABC transporter ATP-binding protein [Desulfobacterales bacterium]|nr:ABC transporter ATP-binding protein [Desulfobacterales bacterium]MBS3756325.1 ABC transporter ATP-binding protein [Desulfobacterales bacterium]
MPPLYELENIRQVYARRVVLEIDQMVVYPGEIIGLSGPNGSGKSTLLRILAMLESPVRGRIFFSGRPANPNDLQSRRQITLLSQSPYLLKRSVLGNVSYGLKLRGITGKKEKARAALSMVGLDPQEFAGRMWYELSGGEAQRVALAARLAIRPGALLLDEPTAYLDEYSAERIRSAALYAVEKWNTALVLVSHDHAWLGSVCQRILQMHRGRLQAS